MKTYVAEIKEIGNPTILRPSLCCEGMTKDHLIKFWGLNLPDVQWFRLYEIVDGRLVEM